MWLVGPVRVIFFANLVGKRHAALHIVRLDAAVPFIKETHHRAAHRLIGIGEAKPACIHAADVRRRLQQDDRGTFTSCRDSSAKTTWRGSIDDDVRFRCPMGD